VRECDCCVRLAPSLDRDNPRRKIVVIDASTLRHDFDKCPMWKKT
jgi:hypothetical protein